MADESHEPLSVKDDDQASIGSRVSLKKSLRLYNGVAVVTGVIIGSGIFVSPVGVLQWTGSVGGALLAWIFCGVLAAIGALCYAELGTTIPKSGADYAYIGEAFGGLPAFVCLWSALLIIIPVGNAITALTFGTYILKPFYPTCEPPDAAIRILGSLAIAFLTVINCYKVRWATRVQDWFTVAKLIALVVIIITGVVWLCSGKSNLEHIWEGSSNEPGAYAVALYQGLFSYAGWNLPRSIWISMPLITFVYLLTNVAYFVVLSPSEMLTSPAVAVTFGMRALGVMAWVMPFSVALSTFGSLNGAILTSSRLFFVGARQGHLPKFLAMVNTSYLTPITSIIFLCICTILNLLTADVYSLITYGSFVEVFFVGCSVSALLYLRWKEPERSRPIRVHLALPITFMFICVFLIIMPLYESPVECFTALVFMLSAIPVYLIFIVWTNKPKVVYKFTDSVTRFIQKLTTSLPSIHHE